MFGRRLVGKGAEAEVTRKSVRWLLDLHEGIDLSIYLFGAFEPSTVRAYSRVVKEGDIVLDIGANIGAHTLYLARQVGPKGRVVAFEPTDYGFAKLTRNIELNPNLSDRIDAVQAMLSDQTEDIPPEVYASWPLEKASDLHPRHLGRLMKTKQATCITLDGYLAEKGINRVDLIKMDIDGYETAALRGAVETLRRHRPVMVMELAPHVLDEHGTSVEELANLMVDMGYQFEDMNSGKPLPSDGAKLRSMISHGASRNVFARPLNR